VSVIDEIKHRLDIVEVISAYTPLQKTGRNYKALCPFHAEKTPSFVVFPESQRWYCFGACGEGGDVFNFVMKQEGWDFRTALEELARQAGVELQPRTPAQVEAEEERDRLLDALQAAAAYYHQLLLHAPEAEDARDYVKRRGLDQETGSQFLLGYSPPSWDRTRAHLTEQGYTIEELVKAGLLVEREDGTSTYDRFRDRLMIPIRDVRGRVIGFGARTLDPEGVPKYLNSPQTPLFDKSQVFYGLDLASKSIRDEDQVIIVEGYMDVMQAHQAGFSNIVAQMGTALTETQLRQIQRYTKTLILALDPDTAGVQATLRGVEVARETLEQQWEPVFDPHGLVGYEARLGAEIRILTLPGGKDPDDLIREAPERWATLVKNAVPVVDFYLQLLTQDLDVNDTKAKAQVVEALLPVLRAISNPVERQDYVQKIARSLRLDVRAVQSRLHRAEYRSARRHRRAPPPPSVASQRSKEADLEQYGLSVLLRRPKLLTRLNQTLIENQLEPLSGKDFQDVEYRAIFETWAAVVSGEHAAPLDVLSAELPAETNRRVEHLLSQEGLALADEQLTKDTLHTLLRIRERNLRRMGRELSFLVREAQEDGDMKAQQYADALQSYKEALLHTQKALYGSGPERITNKV
jgi:DNA primase